MCSLGGMDTEETRYQHKGNSAASATLGMCITCGTKLILTISYVGQTEGFEEQLKSILAQYHFAYEIRKYEAKGVMFKTYVYVPEKHPQSKDTFYEQEDEAHLIKVVLANMYSSI